jgi:hypothetical protein
MLMALQVFITTPIRSRTTTFLSVIDLEIIYNINYHCPSLATFLFLLFISFLFIHLISLLLLKKKFFFLELKTKNAPHHVTSTCKKQVSLIPSPFPFVSPHIPPTIYTSFLFYQSTPGMHIHKTL